jgi:hypothetical protein
MPPELAFLKCYDFALHGWEFDELTDRGRSEWVGYSAVGSPLVECF